MKGEKYKKLSNLKKIVEEFRKNDKFNKGTLGALEVRNNTYKRKGNQDRNPEDYKITNEKKDEKLKKNQSVINTEPENNSTFTGF